MHENYCLCDCMPLAWVCAHSIDQTKSFHKQDGDLYTVPSVEH